MRRVAYGFLFFLAGVLFPILIWVGLGVAVNRWARHRSFQPVPARSIGDILAAAGLTVQWGFPGDKSVAAPVFVPRPMSEIRALLTRAGL